VASADLERPRPPSSCRKLAHGVGYAQFDNDPLFEGPQIHPDTIGRVARACLGLGVVPVFVPPRETGFQAAIEGFNGL
jgi:hypothetical protein